MFWLSEQGTRLSQPQSQSFLKWPYSQAKLVVKPWVDIPPIAGGRSLTREIGPSGKLWRGQAANSSGVVLTNINASGYPLAIVGSVLVRNNSTNNVITTWGNISDGNRIQIDVNAGTFRAIQVGSATVSISVAVAQNSVINFVYVIRSATDRSLWINGRLIGKSATSSTTSAFDRAAILMGVNNASPTGTQEIDGDCFLLSYLNIRLEDFEARMLSADPWRMFEQSHKIWYPTITSSSSLYFQSLSSSVVLTSVISKSTNRLFISSSTLSSGVNKFTNKTTFPSQITTSSSLTEGAGISYSTSGSITISGIVNKSATFVRSYASQIILNGGLVKSIRKVLTGSISLSGRALKGLYKFISGSISLSGILTSFKFTPVPGGMLERGMRFMRRFIGRR